MQKKKITLAFLAYRDDSNLVVEAQRAAINAFRNCEDLEPSYVLLDDAWCPVSKTARETFLSKPNSYRIATGYPRGIMILGGKNLLGQCEAFYDAATLTNAEILVKVDADTLMFKTDWLSQFASDDVAMCAGAFDFQNDNHTSVFGLCYALKAEILLPLLEDVRKFPAHHKAWEDHEVSSRVFRLCNGDMDSLMRWRSDFHGDDFWVTKLSEVNDTFINARAVNFAWDYSITPVQEKPAYREKVAETMKHLNDLVENQENTTEKEAENG